MKASLRSFRKFVPAELVRGLLASGQEAKLGGKRQLLTIYFSDLEGFTTVSEQLEPEKLVELLGEYFAAMTGQILEEGGTVDKYIGDAIMAFWGAPNPRDDHALAACRTALKNQAKLRELQRDWQARGLPLLKVRIGLNTGEAIVGNIGSEDRLDYTAIGDSVNLASRLEGLNKYYGTTIMLSAATWLAVKDDVVARPLDKVSVKGKKHGALVYELLGMKGDTDEAIVMMAETYAAGLDAYSNKDWATARARFTSVIELRGADAPSSQMLERIDELEASPPGQDWDGVYRMESK
jgi:adenylate cyclase